MGFQVWRSVPGKLLLLILNIFTGMALIVEGYNQGVMGGVSGTSDFIQVTQIGSDGVITNATKQGGIVSVYYFGSMVGCFIAGWFGDKYGRKKGVWLGALFGMIGGSLMAASQNANMFICARVITGIGIGFLNTIVPPWISELARAHNRGSNFALIFTSNYIGIIIAYWLNYGVQNNSNESFKWRFPLAFMTAPLILIATTVVFLPESPRWLIANNRREEAVEVLAKVRGDIHHNDPALVAEIEQLEAVVEASQHKRNRIWNIAFGRYSGRLHLGRRAWMSFFTQQMLMWSGIMAITTYSGQLFHQAGFTASKSAWMSGFCNTLCGVFGTLAATLVIDRIGRIKSMLTGFSCQGVVLFMCAAFLKVSKDTDDVSKAEKLGVASASMLFVFLWIFTMFIIVPCFLYATEIWPQEVRAQGYSFAIFGWSVGSGLTTLLIPIMLANIGYGTFILFACFNIIAIPAVYFIYPETNGRSLEEMNLLFASPSLLVKANKREYDRMLIEAGGNIAVAERRLFESVDAETMESDDRTDTLGTGEKGMTGYSEAKVLNSEK
ncbi:putative mfs monosaccharide protein [Penicillium brasilianum]|uniref:Putative mfs monosaccharide protein n=1 Tax=Penicillium brasilianum TaxID=104259 RepID=A0A1S9RE32_PENBI|nr:putative mfs monosaccharide protein [Penicillium brasilianum]